MVCSSSMNVMIWPGRVLDVVEDGLEPFLELAAVLGAGHHRSHVQADDGLVAQALRDVAGHDALGQALDDRGLADAGLADEHRVVLGATGQHLHHATNLVVAPDDRVELAFPGAGGQVGGVLLQRLVGGLGVGAGDPRAAADLVERLAQGLRRGAVPGQQLGDIGVAGGQPDHQVLGGDVFVVHLGGQVLGGGDGGQRFAGQLRLRVGAAGLRQPVQQVLGFGADGGGLDTDSLQQRGGDAVVLRQQRHQQMSGPDLRVTGGRRRLQRRRQGRLRLGCRVERVHDTSVSRYVRKMLVALYNAVKVESVPLNSSRFCGPGDRGLGRYPVHDRPDPAATTRSRRSRPTAGRPDPRHRRGLPRQGCRCRRHRRCRPAGRRHRHRRWRYRH